MKRYCKRFYCDHMGERICCASCRYRRDCDNPCLNHPSRCGLEDLTRGKTAGDNPSIGGADSKLGTSHAARASGCSFCTGEPPSSGPSGHLPPAGKD